MPYKDVVNTRALPWIGREPTGGIVTLHMCTILLALYIEGIVQHNSQECAIDAVLLHNANIPYFQCGADAGNFSLVYCRYVCPALV
jgi:hypothetical protein